MEGMELTHSDTKQMVNTATAYALDPLPPFLYLQGKNGTGKTRIAASIARAFIEAERSVLFAYTPKFIQLLQKGQFTGDYAGRDYFDLMDKAQTVDLLVIDDLGLQNDKNWVDLQLDTIVGVRFMNELATVITSNVLPEKTTSRMRSRLNDRSLCQVVVSAAPDYREKKRRG